MCWIYTDDSVVSNLCDGPFNHILPTDPCSAPPNSSSGRGLEDAEACFNPIGGGASSTCGSFSCNTHKHTLQQESVMNTRSRQVSQRIYLTDTFPNHVSKKKKKKIVVLALLLESFEFSVRRTFVRKFTDLTLVSVSKMVVVSVLVEFPFCSFTLSRSCR